MGNKELWSRDMHGPLRGHKDLCTHVSSCKREALSMQVDKATNQPTAASICHQPLHCWHNRHMNRRAMEAVQGRLMWKPIYQTFLVTATARCLTPQQQRVMLSPQYSTISQGDQPDPLADSLDIFYPGGNSNSFYHEWTHILDMGSHFLPVGPQLAPQSKAYTVLNPLPWDLM